MSHSEISSGGQTSNCENKHWGCGSIGGKRPHQNKLWGQMSRLHFQLGGKCPLIDLLNGGGGGGGGQMPWGVCPGIVPPAVPKMS